MLKTPAMDSDEVVAFMRIFIAHHDGALASDFIPLSLVALHGESARRSAHRDREEEVRQRRGALASVGAVFFRCSCSLLRVLKQTRRRSR